MFKNLKNYFELAMAAKHGKKIITEQDGSYTIVVNS